MFVKPENIIEHLDIRTGLSVADFGAGTGQYVFPIARLVGNTGKVFALDIQKDLLKKIARDAEIEKLPIETVWADIDVNDGAVLGDEVVDRVIIANTLFQVENKEVCVKEMFRVLKDGGTVAVIDWSESHGGLGPTKDTVFTKEQAMELFRSNGFSYLKDVPVGDYHYGLLFRK